MKKILCLLLAAVLCVGLAACASEEDKAFDAANALLEAGDYDGAIEAFSAIGRYQEIADKIEEAQALKDEANSGFLFGTWTDLRHAVQFRLEPNGVGTMAEQVTNTPITYSYSDGVFTLESPVILPFEVVEIDGITHLVCSDIGYDLVSEADYAVLGPQEVTITMDNWSEYFELRQANNLSFNAFGEVEYNEPGYGIFLKDEYCSRVLSVNTSERSVDFEVTYDEACFRVSGFEPGCFSYAELGNYVMEPATAPQWFTIKNGLTATASLVDRRVFNENEQDPYYETVSAKFYCSISATAPSNNDNSVLIALPQNVHVTRAQGSLMLLPG